MPDFLHHETDIQVASLGAERSASAKIESREVGRSGGLDVGKSGGREATVRLGRTTAVAGETQSAGKGIESALPKKKPPSRLFTEYYGAMFLAVIALFILSGFMFLKPLILDYKTMMTDIPDAGATLKDERDYLNSLKASVAAAQAIPPDVIKNIDEALPRTVGIPKLLVTMSTIAESMGVRLSSVSFAAPKSASVSPQEGARGLTLSPVDISLTLSAPDYATMKNYLNRLERNLRIMDVQSINVTGNDKSFEYPIQLRTYTLSPSASGASPQPSP
jgi:hypothetical protein